MKKLLSQISSYRPTKYLPRLIALLWVVVLAYNMLLMSIHATDIQYQIVFGSEQDFSLGFPIVHVMDTDGSNIRLLPLDDHRNLSPACSPDGEYFAFLADTLYVANTDLEIVQAVPIELLGCVDISA